MQKTKQQRLEDVNELIKVIATCGRRFFSENSDGFKQVDTPFIASMTIDERGRIWFIDSETRERVYTHYKHRWKNFSQGGTLRRLVDSFREYITKGKQLRAAYFQPDMGHGFRNPWGYGDDILIVKEAAVRLGIAA